MQSMEHLHAHNCHQTMTELTTTLARLAWGRESGHLFMHSASMYSTFISSNIPLVPRNKDAV